MKKYLLSVLAAALIAPFAALAQDETEEIVVPGRTIPKFEFSVGGVIDTVKGKIQDALASETAMKKLHPAAITYSASSTDSPTLPASSRL